MEKTTLSLRAAKVLDGALTMHQKIPWILFGSQKQYEKFKIKKTGNTRGA